MLTVLGKEGKEWILLKTIWEEQEMPKDYEENMMENVSEQRGDIIGWGSYRGIKVIEHILKVMERIVIGILRVKI